MANLRLNVLESTHTNKLKSVSNIYLLKIIFKLLPMSGVWSLLIYQPFFITQVICETPDIQYTHVCVCVCVRLMPIAGNFK